MELPAFEHAGARRSGTAGKEEDLSENELSELHTPQGKHKVDRRRFIDATTPTLEDEDQDDDQEEEEMVTLERQRLQRAARSSASLVVDIKPGTDNETSLRRTPGAGQMRHSKELQRNSSEEILGFGLALTTPVVGKKDRASPSITRRSPASRPPLDPRGRREDVAYTPASFALTKNPHLHVNSGAFSPNTLRLTEDLDNLLDDGEENEVRSDLCNTNIMGQQEQIESSEVDTESWTMSYIFQSEGGNAGMSRLPSKGRSRRGGSGRRKSDDPACQLFDGQHEVPKPSRSTGDEIFDEDEPNELSRPVNFGGAFVPPNKHHVASNLQRPVPSTASTAQDPSFVPNRSFENPVPHMHHHPDIFHAHPQQQTFNPNMMGHYQVVNNPQLGFVPTVYDNHQMALQRPVPSPDIGIQQQHSAYDRTRMTMGSSSFGQPNFLPPMQQQNWPPVIIPMQMPPQNQYDNCVDHHSPWHNPTMDNAWNGSNFGHNHSSVATNRMSLTPSPHMPPLYPHPQWQDHEAASSFAPAHEGIRNIHHHVEQPYVCGLAPPEEGQSMQEHAQSRMNRKDPRSKKNHEKKQSNLCSNKNEKGRKKQSERAPSPSTKGSAQTKRGTRKKSTTIENESDIKRAELAESPETRASFKEFYKKFRLQEKSSYQEAEAFALKTLEGGSIPSKTHWRVHLELADLAKRTNRFEEARKRYTHVCKIQPYASQGWLEFSKLEEECGRMKRCAELLYEGLTHCELSENLLSRAIKHEEKTNNLSRAREFLARLKHVGIEKVWRTVLEGALLESRAGNHLMARRVLKYLMHHVPWYGPLYLEAFKLERDLGRLPEALTIVEKGLAAIPRYGPLWFGAFRLCETLDFAENAFHLPRTTLMIERAIKRISRELIWKVHLEASQIFERAELASLEISPTQKLDMKLDSARKGIIMTSLCCPSNLSWKVWLAGGRMEISAGKIEVARKLFVRALQVVPEKGKVATLLECARLEELAGDIPLARSILTKSRLEQNTDWKVWLGSVLLEMRDRKYNTALFLAKQAVEKYPGTGRLWACLVQLQFIEGAEDAEYASLKSALSSVPKSGEVWCEGGRIHLNPFSKRFNLQEAGRHLRFATRFTPQYGDGFLETLRLEIIERWVLPMASCIWEVIHPLSFHKFEDAGGWVTSLVDAGVELLFIAINGGSVKDFSEDISDRSILPSLRAQLDATSLDELLDKSSLELRCANADPNYGSMWFNCRHSPTDTARTILRRAREQILSDVKGNVHIYIAAIIRLYGMMCVAKNTDEESFGKEVDSQVLAQSSLESIVIPSIEEILISLSNKKHSNILKGISGLHFSTGLVALQQRTTLLDTPLLKRKDLLFGSDALLS
mmetsp:Transcript_29768/g.44006  ORF Transcript_29768/g.44006 Transcript_29768/m.44006 type:complete len:1359 (+) Transcript_29768:301-4377(+)